MENNLIIRPTPSFAQTCRSAFGIYRWSPIGLLILFAIIFVISLRVGGDPGARVLEWHKACVYGFIGVGVSLCLQFLFACWAYRRGKKKGHPVFILTPAYLQCQVAGEPDESRTLWEAVRRVCVSAHTIYIFTTRTKGFYIVRGDYDEAVIAMARAAGVTVRGRA